MIDDRMHPSDFSVAIDMSRTSTLEGVVPTKPRSRRTTVENADDGASKLPRARQGLQQSALHNSSLALEGGYSSKLEGEGGFGSKLEGGYASRRPSPPGSPIGRSCARAGFGTLAIVAVAVLVALACVGAWIGSLAAVHPRQTALAAFHNAVQSLVIERHSVLSRLEDKSIPRNAADEHAQLVSLQVCV
jgi:hypothetical protein